MDIGLNLPPDQKTYLDHLFKLDRLGLKQLYWSLSTPELTDIKGEYDACLLDQGHSLASIITRFCFGLKGPWVGKAFRPVSDDHGEGYNAFGSISDRKRYLPMDTYIGHSLIIPGESFILNYATKNRGPIRWLRGELRPLTPSIVLGIGVFEPCGGKFRWLRRIIPFVLVKTEREYLS